MCAIAGGFSLSYAGMLELLRHRGRDGCGSFSTGELSLSHALHATHSKDAQPIAGCFLVVAANGEVYNHRRLRKRLTRHRFQTGSDCEAIVHAVEEHYRGDLLEAVVKALPMLDGEFAFAISDGRSIALARDFAGSKPLYYSEAGFASEKKALWAMGQDATCLNPGEVVVLTPQGLRRREVKRYSLRRVKNAEEELSSALVRAVEKRAQHVRRFGILFSGGVDSALLARISASLGYEPRLYSVAMPGSVDERRLKAEKFLGLEVVLEEVTLSEVEEAVDEVLAAIEEPSPLKLSIAIPIFLASKLAAAHGEKVLLTGQGADELFAGYARYASLSREELVSALRTDFEAMHCTNLERDDKAAMRANVELLHPYLDRDVVEIALSLPPNLKIQGSVRKHVLRRVAMRLGLPEEVALREKKAIQYSTGVVKALKKLAKAEGRTLREYVEARWKRVSNFAG